MTKLSRDAGAKLSFPLVQQHATPELWRSVMDRVEKARNEGAEFVAQTETRSIGMVMSWETTYHTFMGRQAYEKIASLHIAQRLARLRDHQISTEILSHASNKDPFVGIQVRYEGMFRLEGEGGELNYEPLAES